MPRSLSINLCLRPFSTAINGKLDLYYFCLFRLFLVCKLYNSGLQIMTFTLDHLRFVVSVDIGDFQQLGYQEGSVSVFSYIFSCFFWSVNCTNQVCMSSHILDMGNVLFESLQYLVFQVLLFLSILNLLFVTIFPDLEMLVLICKLYMPGLQITHLFQTCPKFWTIFIFECSY